MENTIITELQSLPGEIAEKTDTNRIPAQPGYDERADRNCGGK